MQLEICLDIPKIDFLLGLYKEMMDKQKNSILAINTIVNIGIDDVIKIGDYCGVYGLVTKSGRTYVGSSQNIRKRIVNHRGNTEYLFDPIESVIIYTTEDVKSARGLAKTIITDIRPDLNIRCHDTTTDNNTKYAVRNLFRYSKN